MLEMGVATQRRGGGVVHFHAQSVKAPPMMTIMSVNTEEGKRRRRLDDDGNGRSIIMGWEMMATSFFLVLVHLTTRCSAVRMVLRIATALIQSINNV